MIARVKQLNSVDSSQMNHTMVKVYQFNTFLHLTNQ